MSSAPTRALTLWQPWAWLVASGKKNIENRPPGFSHKSFRGDFWIHAGKSPYTTKETDAFLAQYKQAEALAREVLGGEFKLPDWCDLAGGAIIGRATITGILVPRGQMFHKPDVPWHFPDQYGFIVERAEELKIPMPCRGYQGFWTVPERVLTELAKTGKGQMSWI